MRPLVNPRGIAVLLTTALLTACSGGGVDVSIGSEVTPNVQAWPPDSLGAPHDEQRTTLAS